MNHSPVFELNIDYIFFWRNDAYRSALLYILNVYIPADCFCPADFYRKEQASHYQKSGNQQKNIFSDEAKTERIQNACHIRVSNQYSDDKINKRFFKNTGLYSAFNFRRNKYKRFAVYFLYFSLVIRLHPHHQ